MTRVIFPINFDVAGVYASFKKLPKCQTLKATEYC